MGRFDSLTQLEKNPTPVPSLVEEPRKPENLKTGKPEIKKPSLPEIVITQKPENLISGKQVIPKTGNQEIQKAEKYSTQLPPDMIKRIKQYALELDMKDYEVVQFALEAYLPKKKETPKT